jgi:hypothetical protein
MLRIGMPPISHEDSGNKDCTLSVMRVPALSRLTESPVAGDPSVQAVGPRATKTPSNKALM